jgi:hypothetical protein
LAAAGAFLATFLAAFLGAFLATFLAVFFDAACLRAEGLGDVLEDVFAAMELLKSDRIRLLYPESSGTS